LVAVDRADGLRASDPGDLSLLQDAEELHLELQRGVADLVEEQHAAFGGLEVALVAPIGAGECPALVAEESRFEQRSRERRAIERQERVPVAVAPRVDGAGDQLLAGAGLAHHQHGGVHPRGTIDEGGYRLHPRGGPDHLRLARALERGLAVGQDGEKVGPERDPDEVGALLAAPEGPEALDAQIERPPFPDELPEGLGYPVALDRLGPELIDAVVDEGPPLETGVRLLLPVDLDDVEGPIEEDDAERAALEEGERGVLHQCITFAFLHDRRPRGRQRKV
jgi:hypothetical protein